MDPVPAMETKRLPRQKRRRQLLDVASGVFSTRGYHNAAMDDIALAAGVSKPVLYQHFPSKLDLYLALLDEACAQILQLVRAAMASSTDNAERVQAAVASFYQFVADSGRSFRLVFESDLTSNGEVQQRLWQVQRKLAESVASLISHDTNIPAAQARLLGVSMVGMAQVSARYWVSEGASDLTADEASELVTMLAWRGIRAFPRVEGAEPRAASGTESDGSGAS